MAELFRSPAPPVGAPVVRDRVTGRYPTLMRPYEVMFILDASLDEDAIQAVVDRASDLISKDGGSANRVDHWGRRRLAYEIDHRSEGYYVLIEATAEPAVVTELDRMLSLADEVMRHKVIRIPPEAAAKAARRSSVGATGASEVPQPVGGEHA